MRNREGKYSPGNPDSPLAGNLESGRRVWAALAWPLDDFDGADESDLHGRSPTLSSGQAWGRRSTGDARLVLKQGRAVPASGSGEAIYTLDFGVADAHIGFRFRRGGSGGSGGSGVVLRFVSRWDYLRIRFGSTGTFLEDVSFGFPSALRRGDPLAEGVEHFIEIELHGNSVRLYATDLDGGTLDRREILDGGGNAGNLSSTGHGIWHDGSQAAEADSYGSFGGWRSFFHGFLARIAPRRHPELGHVCRLVARDDLAGPLTRPLHHLVKGRNLTSGSIANTILTWAEFDSGHRRLDGGRTLLATEPRALWRLGVDAALGALADEEVGSIYLDGRGYLRLEAANHRLLGPHSLVRATLRDTSTSGAYVTDLGWSDGVDAVENSVAFRYRWGASQGLQEIWRLGDVTAIPAGESRDFLAESGGFDVVDSIRVPVADTDYSANSRRDGAGDDLTGSLAVTLPLLAANGRTPDGGAYGGRGTVVRVENRHSTATAYLSLLRLRADRAYRATDLTSYRAENVGSQASHGLRAGGVECRFIDNYEAARAGAEALLARRDAARRRLSLDMTGSAGGSLSEIVHRVLGDRVRVICADPAIDGDFFIEGMEISVAARTGRFAARWLVEQA